MYHLRVFNILGKAFFPTVVTIYPKKNFHFIAISIQKSIKLCQKPLGLGPTGPCDNQVLTTLIECCM